MFEQRDGYRIWHGGPVPRGFAAMTLGRTIIVRRGRTLDDRLLRHELTHVAQWQRYGLVGFAVRYLAAYLRGRWRGLPHRAAYAAIPFEIEARAAEAG